MCREIITLPSVVPFFFEHKITETTMITVIATSASAPSTLPIIKALDPV